MLARKRLIGFFSFTHLNSYFTNTGVCVTGA